MMAYRQKDAIWNHIISESYLNEGFPNGMTKRKLKILKEKVMADLNIWREMERHSLHIATPEELKIRDKFAYDHAVANFWGLAVML